jgi:hypothetical protein
MLRASDCGDHLDGQFIFGWIALNALYGQRRSEGEPSRDRNDLHVFLGHIVSCGRDVTVALADALANLKADAELLLESEFLYEEYWIGDTNSLAVKIDRASERLRSWPNRESARDLIDLFDRLYLLRNQLFHGSSKDGSGANRASIEPAVRILSKLVPVFCSALSSSVDENWGPLPYPAEGRPGHPQTSRTK